MDLADPLDFRDPNAEKSGAESSGHDPLETFHSREYHHKKMDHQRLRKDRRLNLMRHLCDHGLEDEAANNTETPVKRLDSNSNLRFLGEQLVSQSILQPLANSKACTNCRSFSGVFTLSAGAQKVL